MLTDDAIDLICKGVILLCEICMVIGPGIGYIPQYLEIIKTENTTGFSPFVCFLMVVSNTLRIVYWFRIQYNFSLFLQSLFIIIIMHTIMEEVVYLRVKNGAYITDQVFLDFNYRYFWSWTSILSYIQFTICFFLLMSFLSFFFGGWVRGWDDILGFTALTFEAFLTLPQFYRNIQMQSTAGLSKGMVVFWTLGDIYKAVFYFLAGLPMPFQVCIFVALFLDFAIIFQIFLYGDSS